MMFNSAIMPIDGPISYVYRRITALGRATVLPMLTRIESYSIGKFREYNADPDLFRKRLVRKARSNPDGVGIESLGKVGGNMSVVVPQSQAQISEMLDALDQEANGRSTHASFNFFSGSNSMVLSRVGTDAMHQRKQLVRFLIPGNYVQPAIVEMTQALSIQSTHKLRETACEVIRLVLVKAILGVDKLPESTYQVMKNYRSDVKDWAAFPLPGLFKFMPGLRKKRATYGLFAEEILEAQFDSIVAELGKGLGSKSQNLILMTIIDLIRKDFPLLTDDEFSTVLQQLTPGAIRKYFNHDSVKVLPMLLKAADNLTDALTLCLEKLSLDPTAVLALRDELDKSGFFNEGGENYSQLLSLPILDAWYKESLRMDSPVMVPRYTTKGITYNNVVIPPHTIIFFDLHALNKGSQYWDDPDSFSPTRFLKATGHEASTATQQDEHSLNRFPFLPFSAGKRQCPAFRLTEAMFKSAVAAAVWNFDLKHQGSIEDEILVSVSAVASAAPTFEM